jgi:hypothetical protein
MGRALFVAIASMTSWLKAPCETSAESQDVHYGENNLYGREAKQCGRLNVLDDLGQLR